MATVLEGLMELTFGLREISTSVAFTTNFAAVVLCGGFITCRREFQRPTQNEMAKKKKKIREERKNELNLVEKVKE